MTRQDSAHDLLARLLDGSAGVFALTHRPESADRDTLELLAGEVKEIPPLADLDLPAHDGPGSWSEILTLAPYRQPAERGFAAPDDGTPLLAMTIREQAALPLHAALPLLPDEPAKPTDGHLDVDDGAYAEIVRRVVAGEIGTGEGAGFVRRRSFTARLPGLGPSRTLMCRPGVAHTKVRSPVCTAVTNPISGTYRCPAGGPEPDGVMDLLADQKESDELYRVVDEELKMTARICPTVTGRPLESAARVISRYEPQGRGCSSGVAALIGRDAAGARTLDCEGLRRNGVGATLVRPSGPRSEAHEPRAKAAGPLAALGNPKPIRSGAHPAVREALDGRDERIADLWLRNQGACPGAAGPLSGQRVLVIDAEDAFTEMIAQQIRSLGGEVSVRRFDERYSFEEHDLVVMGPGPGDPRDTADPKIAHLRAAVARLLEERRPFMAVCLSHQVLSTLLGLELVRRPVSDQGAQHEIDLFGRRERVGFSNTFAAHAEGDVVEHPVHGRVKVSRDPVTGEVHGLRAAGFASVQFHAESVLTVDGLRILGELLAEVAGSCVR